MDNDWAYHETSQARLWDPRCYRSLRRACQLLAEHAGESLSRSLGSLRKAISRLLHHPSTTPEGLLEGHRGATARRCREAPWVLIASDTTFFNFSTHTAVEGLGPINDAEHAAGFLVHSALAIHPEGTPLGVLYQHSWVRDKTQAGQAKTRRKRAGEHKESGKWLLALRGIEKALPRATKALLVQDREADVFAFFAAPRRNGLDLLIRVAQAHRVTLAAEGAPQSVKQAVLAAEVEAYKSVHLGARPPQQEREAKLSIRRVLVEIAAPRHARSPKPKPVRVWIIAATEEAPPEGERGLEWILMSTLPVPDAKEACLLVEYYAHRGLIERLHYVLKSGLGFERLQVDTLPALQKALSLFTMVAWRLMYVLYRSRQTPQAPAEEAISSLEQEVLTRIQQKPVETVAEVVMAVARLGGFRPLPSASVPGIKSLWIGFRKLSDVMVGYTLAKYGPSP
jgi:hypothetical protein